MPSTRQLKIGLSNADKTAMANQVATQTLDKVINGPITIDGEETSVKEKIEDINDALERESQKANVDGNYPTMTVGASESLTPYGENSGVSDDTPFLFQTSGGESDIGSSAYLKALRGKSLVFNQLVNPVPNTGNLSGNDCQKTYDESTNSVTATATSITTHSYFGFTLSQYMHNVKGHKVLCIAEITNISLTNAFSDIAINWSIQQATKTDEKKVVYPATSGLVYAIGTWGTSNQNYLNINGATPVEGDYFTAKNVMIFDLTLMFGVGNEPTTVAEFQKIFPKAYYEYNQGQLISSKSNGYKIVGYNQTNGIVEQGWWKGNVGKVIEANAYRYDMRLSKIKVVPGRAYTIEFESIVGANLKAHIIETNEDNIITKKNPTLASGTSITLQNNTRYVYTYFYDTSEQIEIGNTLPDIKPCFHLTWDGSKTGYEEYYSENYVLPNIELRSAGSVYDELRSDGTLVTKIKQLVIDENTYVEVSGAGGANERVLVRFDAETITKEIVNNVLYNTLTNKYISATANQTYSHTSDKIIALARVQISSSRWCPAFWIYDSALIGKTSEEIKQSLTGLVIYTGDLEPVATIVSSFQELTKIDDFGTQEFTSELAIPVPQGNEFFYPVDYKAFIDSIGGREDINYDASEIVSHTELSESETARDDVDNQLLNAVGGTLRQCLCVAKSLEFDNISVVDLSTLNWTYNSSGKYFVSSGLEGLMNGSSNNFLCTKYKYKIDADASHTDSRIYRANTRDIIVFDFDYTDATEFKNAMKGVLLAYEKASV